MTIFSPTLRLRINMILVLPEKAYLFWVRPVVSGRIHRNRNAARPNCTLRGRYHEGPTSYGQRTLEKLHRLVRFFENTKSSAAAISKWAERIKMSLTACAIRGVLEMPAVGV
jgi:hypothetical protein